MQSPRLHIGGRFPNPPGRVDDVAVAHGILGTAYRGHFQNARNTRKQRLEVGGVRRTGKRQQKVVVGGSDDGLAHLAAMEQADQVNGWRTEARLHQDLGASGVRRFHGDKRQE